MLPNEIQEEEGIGRKAVSLDSHAKEELRKKIGSLEPLECGLDKVRKSVLEKVIPVWSGIPIRLRSW
ncbi:hypothetical protein A3H22_01975 [Candidatus Peribacteria bacterium RIFCSPLOWO2_12_FULL_55_15]|nr:MAG: hypothetical protein A2789_03115 [Candidatus Peribacteria bacterium RIFCSPHIGHO2_01_FULL_54_22]OGJ62410.1 MAG: hypothetical protein A3D12_01310 [Candidatus Peribacteria bacterium RIFCSPHIGHO2_02_FULL_55_24]OGJ63987.1 MAG: hypothetical protein A3E47_02680 [Candidatus Peribacteria bacterium RIFCSPHIGHO2_12_FULL_54_10]OGJ69314.1 MAG: hypothetical protein A3H90_00695 [Candidatus Peribacteria bacterium RIFCSPLOWO2_02_FULL_55_36]OGJ70859.1 MAG: hypothetical protein A3H22_01975 [Candidatus Per